MMNRRHAIGGIAVLTGAFSSLLGYQWVQWQRKPDIELLKSQRDLLNEIGDIIIPETDSPGAKRADVGSTIINIISQCMPRRDQNKFLAGLLNIEDEALSGYDLTFSALTEGQKIEILTKIEEEDSRPLGIKGKVMKKLFGMTFFQMMKELTAYSYFTSEIGATQALNYMHIPGRYTGCVNMTPNQKNWATD